MDRVLVICLEYLISCQYRNIAFAISYCHVKIGYVEDVEQRECSRQNYLNRKRTFTQFRRTLSQQLAFALILHCLKYTLGHIKS